MNVKGLTSITDAGELRALSTAGSISHAALSSEHSRAGASMASQSTNRVSEMEFDDERGGSGSESSQYGGGITKRSSRGSLTGRMSV